MAAFGAAGHSAMATPASRAQLASRGAAPGLPDALSVGPTPASPGPAARFIQHRTPSPSVPALGALGSPGAERGSALRGQASLPAPRPQHSQHPGPLRTARLANRPPSQDFPENYDQLLLQVKDAVGAALADGLKLLEVEFPVASLDAVPGDAEGGIEMTRSMEMMFEFSRMFTATGETRGQARIFFPDPNEVKRAAAGVFSSSPLPLSSLTQISGLEDLGLSTRVDMQDRVQAEDSIFLVAYPYFNVNEMLAVEQLHSSVAEGTGTPMVIFNGELDRIRSGYYPAFFYPKLARLAKSFLPKFEAAFYLHNFKGSKGGKLFRVYPGPWQVLRETGGSLKCVHAQEHMPTLREVALDILPRT